MSRACGMYGGEQRNSYVILLRKPEGKRHLGRTTHRWDDNIKMDLKYERTQTGLLWLRIWKSGKLL